MYSSFLSTSSFLISGIRTYAAGNRFRPVWKDLNRNKIFSIPNNIWLFSVPPHIVPFSFGEEAVSSGAFVTLQCVVTFGDTPVSITWTFHGKKLSHQTDVQTQKLGKKMSILSISSVNAGHSGNYTCTARNKAGSANYTAGLQVYGKLLVNFLFFCASRIDPTCLPYPT